MYSPRVELSEEDLRAKFSSSEDFESFRKRLDEAAASADEIVDPMGIVTRSEAVTVATPTPYGSSSSSGGCSVETFAPTALLLLAPLMLIRRP